MKRFPEKLNVSNRDNFQQLNYERVKCYLRRDIYEHIISKEEKDYFLLDKFDKKWMDDIEITRKMVQEVIPELENLGWTCKLSYGGTGLFIYSNEPPPNCYPDDLYESLE